MNERQQCVEDWVSVQLFVLFHLLKFCLDGCWVRARGGELLNHVSAVCVPETGDEIVVDHFPRYDIEDTGNHSNGEADGKSSPEGNLAFADVVAISSDAEKHHQEREHNGRVADDRAPVKANSVAERHQRDHYQRGDSPRNQPEDGYDLSHILLMWFIRY